VSAAVMPMAQGQIGRAFRVNNRRLGARRESRGSRPVGESHVGGVLRNGSAGASVRWSMFLRHLVLSGQQ
jgi:hypothetical protein